MYYGEVFTDSSNMPEVNGNGSGTDFEYNLGNIIKVISELPDEDVRVILEEISARFNLDVIENVPQKESEYKEFHAKETLEVIDRIITDVYLPFRGAEGYKTERAILVEDPHVPHRENDAEHSWHVAFTLQVFWDNQEKLGINFPPNFDMQKALQFGIKHDIIEIWSEDVDGTTQDLNLLRYKKDREVAAHKLIKEQYPYLNGIADIWEEYENKSKFEAQLISDIDKIIATRIICLDGGKKWQNWDGFPVTREEMCKRYRNKLITPLGHALWDELERDLDKHPEYFPAQDTEAPYRYYPAELVDQGRLFI
jgi:5'-deoxynucleotidase YfbR-like HD superfamily hydrolase